jgi:membrane protease YdiL (CAAX protease family)
MIGVQYASLWKSSEMLMDGFRPSAESAWRLIAVALMWVLLAFASSLIAGFLIGFSGILLQVPWRVRIYGYAGDFAAMSILLMSAIVRGRIIGRGSVSEGLGNHPVKNRTVVLCLALVAIGYAFVMRFFLVGRTIYDLGAAGSTALWLATFEILRLVVIAPLAEEGLCRGWLWTGLQKRWGPLTTILVTSVFWLACHAGIVPAKLIALIPIAFVLGFARHFGQSVRAPILLHSVYNFADIGIP